MSKGAAFHGRPGKEPVAGPRRRLGSAREGLPYERDVYGKDFSET